MKKRAITKLFLALLSTFGLALTGCNLNSIGGGGSNKTSNSGSSSEVSYTLVAIRITHAADKTQYYVGEQLDTTGLEVTASFSPSRTTVVPHDKLEFLGFDSSMPGLNTITVSLTYHGVTKTTSFDVTIRLQGGDEITGTAGAVNRANQMTLEELEAASRDEFVANPNDQFKIVGLTSTLRTAATTFASMYDWLHYEYDKSTSSEVPGGNITVNCTYKDYALLTALCNAENDYFADYALVQDKRSFWALLEDGLLHNYVPSDWRQLGLAEEDTLPLKGIHFNKLFWTNTNFENVTGKRLYNIWQLAGTEADPDHLNKISFQSPTTEQINMSFLVSAYAEENQARINKAYKDYYGIDWTCPSGNYQNAGEQWVAEFIANITRWHSSDGTAMKETQLREDWNEGYVYYGSFAKMKDAAVKRYTVDLNNDGQLTENVSVTCDGKEYLYDENSVNAMDTVKWDWEINGFNGFIYSMDSQIVNNAKFPYTACLFARTLLLEETYTTAVYNKNNPDMSGQPANQYGYYYPGTASAEFRYAKDDWTKEIHKANELNEDFNYLKTVKISTINNILALVEANNN